MSDGCVQFHIMNRHAQNKHACIDWTLTASRCLRTALSSSMVAPCEANTRVVACTSASVSPATGMVSSVDPPPDIRTSTTLSADSAAYNKWMINKIGVDVKMHTGFRFG